MTLMNMVISSIGARFRLRMNSTLMRMKKWNKNDSTILLSKKLEGNRLFYGLLTTILSSLPKSFVNPIALALSISAKSIYFTLVPLPIVYISCFISYPPSAVFLSVDELPFIEMSLFYNLNAMTVLFNPALLVETHITEIDISCVMKNDGLCDVGHQGKDEAVFVFFDVECHLWGVSFIEEGE